MPSPSWRPCSDLAHASQSPTNPTAAFGNEYGLPDDGSWPIAAKRILPDQSFQQTAHWKPAQAVSIRLETGARNRCGGMIGGAEGIVQALPARLLGP
jgi:hypothetical protein